MEIIKGLEIYWLPLSQKPKRYVITDIIKNIHPQMV